jgi:catechol 2,3-dioxygenase-like lactoylglutathione lyase family enzyme
MIDIIHFYKVDDLKKTREFYQDVLGCSLYKDQGSCLIYDVKGLGKIGFCTHHPTQKNDATCITFVYETKEEVDAMYALLKNYTALEHPHENTQFQIYQFFAKDPNGLTLEFQVFL